MTRQPNIVTIPHFAIKHINSDFVVDEVYIKPQLVSEDKATHTYLWVQKENLTTFQLIQMLADYFCMDVNEVSAAGLKDEEAITRQIISVQAVISGEEVEQVNKFFKAEGLIISIEHIIGYGQAPVYPRKLHGNKFSITIRNLVGDVAQSLTRFLETHKFFPLINYYDEQRFGLPDSIHNTHLIGQALLADDWSAAYHEYLKSGNDQQEGGRVKATFAQSQSHYAALQAIMPSKLNFFISSYNSLLWNKTLNEKIVTLSDVVRAELPYIGVVSLPMNNQAIIPTTLSIAVEKKNWQSGQNVPTIKTRPVILNIPVYLLSTCDDELHPNQQAMTVSFYLPTGCYATMLVKQLLLAAVEEN